MVHWLVLASVRCRTRDLPGLLFPSTDGNSHWGKSRVQGGAQRRSQLPQPVRLRTLRIAGVASRLLPRGRGHRAEKLPRAHPPCEVVPAVQTDAGHRDGKVTA